MTITLQTLHQFTPQQIARLNAAEIRSLAEELGQEFKKLNKAKAKLEAGIEHKYGLLIASIREMSDKETGVVHLQDDEVAIHADRPKKVEWNQDELEKIANRIQSNGDDPKEFIEITYKVSERKYTAWPTSLKEAFNKARTLKHGKQTITFSEVKDGEL